MRVWKTPENVIINNTVFLAMSSRSFRAQNDVNGRSISGRIQVSVRSVPGHLKANTKPIRGPDEIKLRSTRYHDRVNSRPIEGHYRA